jgi:DNA polymerase elongation subunit (family B)
MKILLLDIETSPNTAHVWGLWQQNIGLSALLESSYVLCWAAKWLGEREMFFDSVYQSEEKDMLLGIHKLLEEADAVVHYNGTKFDMPTLNKEFLIHEFDPPAPYNNIDLLRTVRNRFRFPSNKLDYVAQRLGLGKKKETNFKLWIDCMNKDPRAWKKMELYNKQDVILLEKVYNKVLPWIKNHPNRNLYNEQSKSISCPSCGSTKLHKRGIARSIATTYQRYQCQDCGTWSRSNKAETSRVEIKAHA